MDGRPELQQQAPRLCGDQNYLLYLIPFPSHIPEEFPHHSRRKNLGLASTTPPASRLHGAGKGSPSCGGSLPSISSLQSRPPHELESVRFRYRLEPFLTNSSEIAQSLAGTFKYYADGAEPQPNWRHLDFLW